MSGLAILNIPQELFFPLHIPFLLSIRFSPGVEDRRGNLTGFAPSIIGFYRWSLETVYPQIENIKLNRLRSIALENLLVELRKRTYYDKPIHEATVQKYLTVVSAVLNDAKRNKIIEKNPARLIDLPETQHRTQMIPTD